MFTYTDAMLDAIQLLRDAGFAVVCFDTEELGGVEAGELEDHLVHAGFDAIETLKGEQA